MGKGKFITFEGVDGAGKTTQISLFSNWLLEQGEDVLLTREPGGDKPAEAIRSVILDPAYDDMDALTEAYLYAAARCQHVRRVLRPAIESGRTVICDRYLDSSLAYQGGGRGLGIELVRELNREAVDGCLPDWTVLLLLNPEAAMERMEGRSLDRLEQTPVTFRRKIYDSFLALAEAAPERIFTVDAAGTVEMIAETIRGAYIARFGNCQKKDYYRRF
ncbi:MAG: dTMP kinase [Christensenellales bacterium]|jgi:dTMP kinase